MKEAEEAKNLLLEQSCDNCTGYNDSPYDGAICLWFNVIFPENRTCWDWSDDRRRYGHTNPTIGESIERKEPHEWQRS